MPATGRRRGMQLLELVISLTTASILMAGISAALSISKRTLDAVSLQASSVASAQGGIQLMQNDLREARQVDNRTATSIDLKLPDRDNDGVLESVRYRWNATAGPLETSTDGVTWRALTPSLTKMQLNWRSRDPQSLDTVTPLDGNGISYLGMETNSRSDSAKSLSVAAPSGYIRGDACVAVVAVSNNPGNIKADGNWIKISQAVQDNSVALAFWYTTNLTGTTTFSWGSGGQTIGCIVHLSGNNSNPYVSNATATALSQLPAPGIAGSHSQEFVIRALAGIGSAVQSDTPSVVGHGTVLLRQVDVSSSYYDLTLAVACQAVPNTSIDPAYFQFSPASLISCTGTVALRP